MYRNLTDRLGMLAGVAVVLVVLSTNVNSADEPDPRALLERMSSEISALDKFILEGELYADYRLDAGQLIEQASTVTMRVRRPDAMRLTIKSSDGLKELYFGEGLLTFYSSENQFYAQTEMSGDVAKAAEFAVKEVGIDAPLLDFLSNSLVERLQEGANEVQYLGMSEIRGDRFHHIGIRLPEIDVQIWVASGARALPGKMALSAKWQGGAPRTVMFFDWDSAPEFPAAKLEFVPPSGSSQIEFELGN